MKVINRFQWVVMFLVCLGFFGKLQAQTSFSEKLAESYSAYKEKTIDQRRFTREELQPLIKDIPAKSPISGKEIRGIHRRSGAGSDFRRAWPNAGFALVSNAWRRIDRDHGHF